MQYLHDGGVFTPPFLLLKQNLDYKKGRCYGMSLIDAFQSLTEFGLGNAITVLFLFMILCIALFEGCKKLLVVFGLETKKAIKERELNEKITQLENDIKELQGSAKKFNDDRVNDRAQSFEKQGNIDKKIDGVQSSLTSMINSITETQKEIIKKVDSLAEQSRKYQLADMRETLLQAHRYYTSDSTNPLRMWTELEKHAWDEQYDVYVANKGNGYMQNIIKPEMDKLRVVSLDDYETMAELMASRTKNRN